jgi:chromosomal replication initiator protein
MVCDTIDPTSTSLQSESSLATELAPEDALSRICSALRSRIGRQRFDVWFAKSTRMRLSRSAGGDRLTVVVPNDFVVEWIRKHFDRQLGESIGECLRCSLPVAFEIDADLFEGRRSDPDLFTPEPSGIGEAVEKESAGGKAEARPPAGYAEVRSAAEVVGLGLPPVPPVNATQTVPANARVARLRHELDDFLPGPNNQLALDCCNHVAESPGGLYNPLFIHGGVGLGKTHLLQGLCRRYARLNPAGRWAYLTGEEFTNEFITCIRTNRVDSFRRRMRDLDLLVIDDVHFLGGKRATQEEFLHTFNAIEATGRHVVIASDAHPKLISTFGESLINRFVSGMVARVDAPNREGRETLLRALALRQGLELTEDAVHWIAQRVTQNVRELEGAVTRMAAHVRLGGRRADVALAAEVLHDLDRQLQQPVRAEQIFEAVREFFGLERSELMSGRRQRTISLARSIAMYLARQLTSLSYPEIAGRMGKRNHSTVISACRRIKASINSGEVVSWTSSVGERSEPADELVQRLEELSRAHAS